MNRILGYTYTLIVCCTIALWPCAAEAASTPTLTDRVVDEAGILNSTTIDNVQSQLKLYEQQTGNQFVVVTVNSLNGRPIEEYTLKLGRKWGIGQKDKNNGLILLIAPNEREVRIEVGYGLEGTFTDARTHAVIQKVMSPHLKKDDYNTAVRQAVTTMIGGDFSQLTTHQDDDIYGIIFYALIMCFMFLGLILQVAVFIINFFIQWIVTPPLNLGSRTLGFKKVFLFALIVLPTFLKNFYIKGNGGGGRFGGGSSGGGFSGGGGSFGGGGSSGRF